jgi:hypothetical protein
MKNIEKYEEFDSSEIKYGIVVLDSMNENLQTGMFLVR